jgi:hypothetical protein
MKEPVGLLDAKGLVRIAPVGCREVRNVWIPEHLFSIGSGRERNTAVMHASEARYRVVCV